MTAPGDTLAVCVIGVGPRGLSVLERICANAAGTARPVAVHLVDPYPPGPGAVWRTGQPGELLMNTVASQVTLFTDDSVDCAGPSVPGPSLYPWARMIERDNTGRYPLQVLDEARRLGPDSYPTRALHGHYLEWVFRHLLRTAPEEVTVHQHRSTERLTVALAPALGKARAKTLLTAATAEASATGRPLAEVLREHPELSARFTPVRLAQLLDPAGYTGAADALVDRALRAYGGPGVTPDDESMR
ncbi:FAD/NAD(P)-binding protein [Streptomyces djakartensis]|uniref:Adenylosuccinate lyase C-terminal domain-containing protein n=1 Tax=Streptomyces djakartensis TaxID=68193 RepID=A0ABQ2ZD75_9ACTN|nr:FAD/NAD(P)-binding protein [Streptomyces djakartensis]GGY13127.1 hypothetical protein GCM10010384_18470 [Streptomyces djakartensis]